MSARLCVAALCLAPLPVPTQDAAPQTSRAPEYEVTVDARLELLSILGRLAGFEEYNQSAADSPYARAVDAYFEDMADHVAVRTLQRLRLEAGISHDALATFAAHVTDVPSLEERVDFAECPGRLEERWPRGQTRPFLAQLRDFVGDSDFVPFLAEHEALYASAAERLKVALEGQLSLDWFQAYFGAKPEASFRVHAGLLLGAHNYGVGVRFADGREELCPAIGAWEFDESGLPVYSEDAIWVSVHEFAHSYVNPLVDAHLEALAPAAQALHPLVRAAMDPLAYTSWRIVLCENLTRATVVRYLWQNSTRKAAAGRAVDDHQRGFLWVSELVQLLEQYEGSREQYATLDAFMPQVAALFARIAEAEAELAPRRPRVVAIAPADGASDVDPELDVLRIEFDRPMLDRSWSVVGSPDQMPTVRGQPSYDEQRTVLTIPVTLERGRSYAFGLNSPSKQGFCSESGAALIPVRVAFRTR